MAKKEVISILKSILGIFLIALGISGLFLPFLQGILLIILGLSLLFKWDKKDIKNKWKKIKKDYLKIK